MREMTKEARETMKDWAASYGYRDLLFGLLLDEMYPGVIEELGAMTVRAEMAVAHNSEGSDEIYDETVDMVGQFTAIIRQGVHDRIELDYGDKELDDTCYALAS